MRGTDLLSWAIATAGGAGCLRPAPGTWGSLVAALCLIPLWYFLPHEWLLASLLLLTLGATLLGAWSCRWAISHYQRGDPSQVVIDEVAGVWLTYTLVWGIVPSLIQTMPLAAIVIAFLWFRCFDILKPWPVSWFEKIPGPWGIMSDDLAAAFPAASLTGLSLWGLAYFL